MLKSSGFDDWAGEYVQSISRLSNGYPFEGYYDVLSFVNERVNMAKTTRILDIGVGTGLLTKELYRRGAEIYGIDFSSRMLELAQTVMPNGYFLCHDFSHGMPVDLKPVKFDYIISSYAFHHIGNTEKINFILELTDSLDRDGKIVIADIAFRTKNELMQCKRNSVNWDEDEIYMTADEITEKLNRRGVISAFTQISSCAGVLEVVPA